MIVLRAEGAAFVAGGDAVGPLDVVVRATRRETLAFGTAREAAIAARLCAGIVKPTRGTIFVGEFDTRLQPPQAKRCVGFVDGAGFDGDAHAFACEIAFRAEVWDLDVAAARARTHDALVAFEAVADARDAYARALVLALVPDVALLVLDRPPSDALLAIVTAIAPNVAILATVVDDAA